MYKDWENPALKCPVCNYVPSDNDLLNGYELKECDKCGRIACDTCRKHEKCCLESD